MPLPPRRSIAPDASWRLESQQISDSAQLPAAQEVPAFGGDLMHATTDPYFVASSDSDDDESGSEAPNPPAMKDKPMPQAPTPDASDIKHEPIPAPPPPATLPTAPSTLTPEAQPQLAAVLKPNDKVTIVLKYTEVIDSTKFSYPDLLSVFSKDLTEEMQTRLIINMKFVTAKNRLFRYCRPRGLRMRYNVDNRTMDILHPHPQGALPRRPHGPPRRRQHAQRADDQPQPRAHARRATPHPPTAPPPTSDALASPLVCAGPPPPPIMTPPSYPPPCHQDPSFRTNSFIQNAKNRGAFHKKPTPATSSTIVGSSMVSPSTCRIANRVKSATVGYKSEPQTTSPATARRPPPPRRWPNAVGADPKYRYKDDDHKKMPAKDPRSRSPRDRHRTSSMTASSSSSAPSTLHNDPDQSIKDLVSSLIGVIRSSQVPHDRK